MEPRRALALSFVVATLACSGRAAVQPDGGHDAGQDESVDAATDQPPCRRAEDTVGDGLDQNCDGLDGVDHDGDAFAAIESGGDDCNDGRDDVNPGSIEVPGGGMTSAFVDQGRGVRLLDVTRGDDAALQVLYAAGGDAIVARLRDTVWSFESLGIWPSDVGKIAPDSSIHLAHECATGVCYVTKTGGLWVEEPVDPALSGDLGPLCMGLGPTGEPILAYIDRGDNVSTLRLLAARRTDDGAWSVHEVAMGVNGRLQCAVDGSGALHVMYKLLTAESVMYATDASGSWASSSTATAAPGGWGVMAVDASGIPHLVVAWGGLEYRTIVDGTWVAETVPSAVTDGVEALAVASAATLHVLSWNQDLGGYGYAMRLDGQWSNPPFIEILAGHSPFLVVDRGLEIVDVFHFEDPKRQGCFDCAEITQLRYTGAGPLDEDCDGVAE